MHHVGSTRAWQAKLGPFLVPVFYPGERWQEAPVREEGEHLGRDGIDEFVHAMKFNRLRASSVKRGMAPIGGVHETH
jgi:hypothetical protein